MALGICVSRVVPKNSKEAAHTFEKIIFSLRNISQAITDEKFEQRSRPHVLMLITCEILDFIARRVAAKDPEAPVRGHLGSFKKNAGFTAQHVTIHTNFQRDTNKFNS